MRDQHSSSPAVLVPLVTPIKMVTSPARHPNFAQLDSVIEEEMAVSGTDTASGGATRAVPGQDDEGNRLQLQRIWKPAF